MSLWLLTGAIVSTCALMIVILWGLRRWGARVHGVGAFLIVGSPFGVLLAFVILVSFQDYNTTRSNAEIEATKVVNLNALAEQFPTASGRELEATLTCYARATISLEWPAMDEGGDSPVVDLWVRTGTAVYDNLVAGNENQRQSLALLPQQNFQRADARQVRLDEARTTVPAPLALVLILGAILVLADVLCMAEPRETFARQAIMVAAITVVTVFGLLLVQFFDNPFADEPGGLRPDAMERALTALEHEHATQVPPVPTLCTKQGRPAPS